MNNKILLALLVTVAAAAAAAATVGVDANAKKPAAKAAVAAPRVSEVVVVDVAPPAGNWESPQAPANGHVWSGGYYEWKDGRYAWKSGEWMLAREGMQYRQHKWVQHADGKWLLTGGEWVGPQDKVAGRH